MASLLDTQARLTGYLRASNANLAIARGMVSWAIATAFSAGGTDTQGYIDTVALASFLSSSSGDTLTAKCADYGVYRLWATSAYGPVIFSRSSYDAQNSYTIPAGTQVQAMGVPGVPAAVYQTAAQATIPVGALQSNQVTATALIPGTAGNANTGMVTVLPQPPQGVTGVTNPAPMSYGVDAESDGFLLSRTIALLAPANSQYAVQGAIKTGVSGVFAVAIYDPTVDGGTGAGLGVYSAYVGDSLGNLTSGMTQSAYSAIATTGMLGLTPHVIPFGVVTQAVAVTLTVLPTATFGAVSSAVASAITTWVQNLPPGTPLRPFDLINVCEGAPGYTGFSQIAGIADLVVTTPSAPVAANAYQLLRLSGSVTVTQGPL